MTDNKTPRYYRNRRRSETLFRLSDKEARSPEYTDWEPVVVIPLDVAETWVESTGYSILSYESEALRDALKAAIPPPLPPAVPDEPLDPEARYVWKGRAFVRNDDGEWVCIQGTGLGLYYISWESLTTNLPDGEVVRPNGGAR